MRARASSVAGHEAGGGIGPGIVVPGVGLRQRASSQEAGARRRGGGHGRSFRGGQTERHRSNGNTIPALACVLPAGTILALACKRSGHHPNGRMRVATQLAAQQEASGTGLGNQGGGAAYQVVIQVLNGALACT